MWWHTPYLKKKSIFEIVNMLSMKKIIITWYTLAISYWFKNLSLSVISHKNSRISTIYGSVYIDVLARCDSLNHHYMLRAILMVKFQIIFRPECRDIKSTNLSVYINGKFLNPGTHFWYSLKICCVDVLREYGKLMSKSRSIRFEVGYGPWFSDHMQIITEISLNSKQVLKNLSI